MNKEQAREFALKVHIKARYLSEAGLLAFYMDGNSYHAKEFERELSDFMDFVNQTRKEC